MDWIRSKAPQALHTVLLLLALCGWLPAASADTQAEYRIKSAFIYNFAIFTQWPATVGNPLTLCVFGPDPFGAEIDKLQEKSVAGRAVTVRRVNSASEMEGCHLIFITRPMIEQLPRVLESVSGRPVLIVADSNGAARLGVALNMGVEQGKITFEANLAAARGNGLDLSSKLLNLAREVYR